MGNFSDYINQFKGQGSSDATSVDTTTTSFADYAKTKSNIAKQNTTETQFSVSATAKTIPVNVLTPEALKSSEMPNLPVSSDERLIQNYESLPKYNALERFFSQEKNESHKNAQEMRQSLYPEYRAAKDKQVEAFVKSKGIPMETISQAISGNVSSGMASNAQRELKQKYGLTNAQIKEVIDYGKSYYSSKADEAITEASKEHPVAMTALRVAEYPIQSMYNTAKTIGNKATGEATYKDTTKLAETITSAVTDKIRENTDSKWGGDVAANLYSAGVSMADVVTARVIQMLTGIPTSVLQGMEKASSVMTSAGERGLTTDQVILEGLVIGTMDAWLTEKYGTGNMERAAEEVFATGLSNATAKQIVKAILSQTASEGLQEMEEDIVDMVADGLIATDKNEILTEYKKRIANGETKDEATKNVIVNKVTEVAIDGLLGAFTGGFLEATDLGAKYSINAYNTLNNDLNNISFGNMTEGEIPKLNEQKIANVEQNVEADKTKTETVNELKQAPVVEEIPVVEQAQTSEMQNAVPGLDPLIAEIEAERDADVKQNMPDLRESEYSNKSLSENHKGSNKEINDTINMFGGEIGKRYKENLYSLLNEYEATRNPELLTEINEIVNTLEQRMQGASYTTKPNKRGNRRTYNYPSNRATLTESVNGVIAEIVGHAQVDVATNEQTAVENVVNQVGNEATTTAYNSLLNEIAETVRAVENGATDDEVFAMSDNAFNRMGEMLESVPEANKYELMGLLNQLYSTALNEASDRRVEKITQVDNGSTMNYADVEGDATNGTDNKINKGTGNGNTERGEFATRGQSADRDAETRRTDRSGNSGVSSRNLVSAEVAEAMNTKSVADLGIRESNDKVSFVEQLDAAKKANAFGYMVDAQTVESLTENGARIFTDENGTAGFVIEKDGNIAAVHKNEEENHTKRASRDLVLTARENGGTKMDCYGIKLARLYEQLGFVPVAVVDWNENYRPDDWPADKPGEPIYVLMKDTRTTKQVIEDLDGNASERVDLGTLPHFDKDGYYDAKDYRDQLLAQQESSNIPTIEGPRIMAEDAGIGNTSTDVETELPDGSLSVTGEELPYLKKRDDGSYVSQTAYNTIQRNVESISPEAGDKFLDNLYDDSMVVETITEPESQKRAVEAVQNDYEGEKARLERMDSIGDGVDTDESMLILENEVNRAVETGNYSEVNRWARVIVDRMHKIGEAMQALAKYSRTAPGTIAKADVLRKHKTESWEKASINHRKVERAGKIAKALQYVIVGENTDSNVKRERTHEQILEGVKNEFNDTLIVANEFNDEDIDFLATLIEQGTPAWIIANEIENKIETGSWYDTIEDASKEQRFNKSTNQKLNSLISQLKEKGVEISEKRTKSFEEIRKEVENTLMNSKDYRNMTDDEIDYVARMVERGASTDYIKKQLVEYKATGNFGLSNEDIKTINDLFEQMQELNPESKEATKLWNQACAIASKATGDATFAEKLRSWRYMAMLLNPSTHGRNIFGNGMFGAVTDIKDEIAAGIETMLAKNNSDFERTKSHVSKKNDADFLNKAGEYFDNNAYATATEGGSKFAAGDNIQRQKRIFKNNKLEKARKFSSDTLEVEDEIAIKRKYKRALVGYLKANGADANIFASENPEDIKLLKKASEYAVNQAQIATFHEKNKTAEVLSQWSTTAAEGGTAGTKALSLALESNLPFKKTPANVLKQGAVEYNPLVDFARVLKTVVTGQNVNTSETADNLAKGITGAGLLIAGILARSAGLIKGDTDDDDEFFGDQKYSITVGDFSYTIDWAAPGTIPVLAGVALYDAFEDGQIDGAELLDALASIGNPIVETTMLQGISNTIENIAYSVQDQKNAGGKAAAVLGATASSMATNYASQYIPTIVSKTARVIDPYQRSTYTKNKGVVGTGERFLKKSLNSIPFLSMLNDAKVDEWGEEKRNSGFFSEMFGADANPLDRAVANYLSPGYAKNTERTPMERELERLNNTDPEKNIIPSSPDKTYDGERLSQEQYTALSKSKGQYTKKALTDLFRTVGYKSLDDTAKAVVVNNLEGFCNNLAKKEVLGYKIENNSTYKKAYGIYKTSGMSGVIDYYNTQAAIKSETKSTKYSDVIPVLESLDMSDADKGLYIAESKSNLTKRAKELAEEKDYESLYQYYVISNYADTNHKSGTTKTELEIYLNGSSYSAKECQEIYLMFFPDTDLKDIPKFH